MSIKRGTTLRLEEATHSLLDQAAHILGRTKSQIAEEALTAYFEEHEINCSYQLNLTPKSTILMKMVDPMQVVEVRNRNGVPPRELQRTYSERLRSHVRLVIQEDEDKENA